MQPQTPHPLTLPFDLQRNQSATRPSVQEIVEVCGLSVAEIAAGPRYKALDTNRHPTFLWLWRRR